MIAQMEDQSRDDAISANNFAYGLTLKHKHVPEMKNHGLLDRARFSRHPSVVFHKA